MGRILDRVVRLSKTRSHVDRIASIESIASFHMVAHAALSCSRARSRRGNGAVRVEQAATMADSVLTVGLWGL